MYSLHCNGAAALLAAVKVVAAVVDNTDIAGFDIGLDRPNSFFLKFTVNSLPPFLLKIPTFFFFLYISNIIIQKYADFVVFQKTFKK